MKTEESLLVAETDEDLARNSGMLRQREAVILREVSDAERGEIVQGEQGCC